MTTAQRFWHFEGKSQRKGYLKMKFPQYDNAFKHEFPQSFNNYN